MAKSEYSNLRNTILAAMMVAPAIPFVLVTAIGFYYFMTSLRSETISVMSRVVDDHRRMIESFLDERTGDLRFAAAAREIEELLRPEVLTRVYADLRGKSEAFTDIGLFNEDGVHVAYHGPYALAGRNYADAFWFKQVMARGVYISDVFLGFRNSPHFIIAVTTKGSRGRPWVIRATVDTSLFSHVVEEIRIGKTGEAYIVNKAGFFQTRRRSGGELMKRCPDLDPRTPSAGRISSFVGQDSSGESFLYSTTWLRNPDWLLVGRQETSEAFQAQRKATYLVILVAILGGLMITFTAFQVTRLIIRRMELLDTEKKELGRQLVVAGRLAEIGEMSAGFAHEINNPLQIIKSELMLAETILDDIVSAGNLPPSDDMDQVRDSMSQILTQVDRCGGITQGLLKFARKKESKAVLIDLSAFLPQVIGLLENKAHVEGIDIDVDIVADAPPVNADPAHLEQVLINLLNNALFAVSEHHGSSGGRVRVAAGSDDGAGVVISVSDNGPGIPAADLEKIFTPFYTTKPVGQGTGLGLSICYGIVEEMGGVLEVSSEPGQGATFKIRLRTERAARERAGIGRDGRQA